MSRYVKKEAFIALLNKRIYCLCGGETVKETRNIRDMLEVFPAADVKPVVRGEWVHRKVRHSLPMDCPPYYGEEYDRESHSCLEDEWHCSNCDYENDDIDKEWMNFCPNCGAEMRKEAKDE